MFARAIVLGGNEQPPGPVRESAAGTVLRRGAPLQRASEAEEPLLGSAWQSRALLERRFRADRVRSLTVCRKQYVEGVFHAFYYGENLFGYLAPERLWKVGSRVCESQRSAIDIFYILY